MRVQARSPGARAARRRPEGAIVMKPLYHTPNPAEAALICGFLQENGIQAVVANEGLTLGFGELPIDPSTMPTSTDSGNSLASTTGL